MMLVVAVELRCSVFVAVPVSHKVAGSQRAGCMAAYPVFEVAVISYTVVEFVFEVVVAAVTSR